MGQSLSEKNCIIGNIDVYSLGKGAWCTSALLAGGEGGELTLHHMKTDFELGFCIRGTPPPTLLMHQ